MSTNALDSEPEFTVGAVPTERRAEAQRPKPGPSSRPTIVISLVLAAIVGAAACYLQWPRDVTATRRAGTGRIVFISTGADEPRFSIPWANPSSAARDSRRAISAARLDYSDAVAKDVIDGPTATLVHLLVPVGSSPHCRNGRQLPRKTIAQPILPIESVPGCS
jgi:hypothetical protein